MATIRKRGDTYRVEIRKKGAYESASFLYKKDAEEWARKVERDLDKGEYQLTQKNEPMTLKMALADYLKKITPDKKGESREKNRIKKWMKHPLASKRMDQITGKDLAEFRDSARDNGLSPASVRIELMLLSSVFKVAQKEWGYTNIKNPVKDISLPKQSNRRKRRLEPHELDYILAALPKAFERQKNVRELILLAIETGMREGEILHIDWDDVNFEKKFIYLDSTKSGDPRSVPLSTTAIDILKKIKKAKGQVFHINQSVLIRGFQRACMLGLRLALDDGLEIRKGFLDDLRFHDLRHEAASRWAGILEMHELCNMFGWKTPAMALRYYHPNPTDIAEKLG